MNEKNERKINLSGIALVIAVFAIVLIFSSSYETAKIGNILSCVSLVLLVISLITKNNTKLSWLIGVILCVVCLMEFSDIKVKHENELAIQNEYNALKYTITFDTDGGSPMQPLKVSESTKLDSSMVPTKKGFVFAYWTLNGEIFDFSGYVNKRITSDITLKANYSIDVSDPDVTVIKETHGPNDPLER